MTVLVIAPHADDETLGMGGSIARFVRAGRRVVVAVMTGPGDDPHPLWPSSTWDGIRLEMAAAMDELGVEDVLFENLPAATLGDLPVHEVNAAVNAVIDAVGPTELFLPYLHDLHHDHRALAYAGVVAARPYLERGRRIRMVAMYETPSETNLFPPALQPAFAPNHWIDVTDTLEVKLRAWSCYKSQHLDGATPRSAESLRALATYRGSEVGLGAAEGFSVIRLVE